MRQTITKRATYYLLPILFIGFLSCKKCYQCVTTSYQYDKSGADTAYYDYNEVCGKSQKDKYQLDNTDSTTSVKNGVIKTTIRRTLCN